MKEYQLQIKIVNYLKSKKLSKFRFFHVPNQGVRSVKHKLLLARVAISGLMSAQHNLPYVDEISAVQAENGVKFVITLQDNEYYDPS